MAKDRLSIIQLESSWRIACKVPLEWRNLPGVMGGGTEEGPWVGGEGYHPELAFDALYRELGRIALDYLRRLPLEEKEKPLRDLGLGQVNAVEFISVIDTADAPQTMGTDRSKPLELKGLVAYPGPLAHDMEQQQRWSLDPPTNADDLKEFETITARMLEWHRVQAEECEKWLNRLRPRQPGPGMLSLMLEKGTCQSGQDGECNWEECPQARDGEPMKTGRHCPLWKDPEDE